MISYLLLVSQHFNMISEKAKKILSEHEEVAFYLRKVIEQIRPQKVILFGSKASGPSTSSSDTDFDIVADGFIDTTGIFGAVDMVDLRRASGNLRDEIIKEGIVIYER